MNDIRSQVRFSYVLSALTVGVFVATALLAGLALTHGRETPMLAMVHVVLGAVQVAIFVMQVGLRRKLRGMLHD